MGFALPTYNPIRTVVNFLRESQEKAENSNIEHRPTKKNHSELNTSVAWVGVNSRWGSIFSISLFDWGSIMIFVGWGSNQDWGLIRADTVLNKKGNKISL